MKKTKKIFLAVALAVVACLSASLAIGCGHSHSLKKVDGKAATCTEAGVEAYYKCEGCEEIFADAAGKTAIEAPKTIAALGHDIEAVAGQEATCAAGGTEDHYKCKTCNVLFSDAEGETVITAPATTPKAAHTLTKTEAKAATCTEAGNNAYWTCSGACGKVYADEACTQETTVAAQTIAALGHSYATTLIVSGAKTTYEPGESFDKTNLVVKLDCSACDHEEEVTGYTLSKEGALEVSDNQIVISYVKNSVTYTATVAITVKHEHTLGSLVPAVDPTCTEEGNVAYYECTVCHSYFSDSQAQNKLETVVVPATNHANTVTKTDAKESSCTEQGNNAYWSCSACDKVFADEACTQETTVADQTLPLADHDTVYESDDTHHWVECSVCDYSEEDQKELHKGAPYPDADAVCEVCNKIYAQATTDGWVLYRPSTAVPSGITAQLVEENGIMVSKYTVPAGTTEFALEHDHDNDANYQIRLPEVTGNPTYVLINVTNHDTVNAVSFNFQEHNTPANGVKVTLAAGETKAFKFSVSGRNVIGDWYQIVFEEALANEANFSIYGYFYVGNFELQNVQANITSQSYKVGEAFDLSDLRLTANIVNSEGELLKDTSVETYMIDSNFVIDGFEQGHVFTGEDAGSHNVEVSFAGYTVIIPVVVSGHDHAPEYVAYKAPTCTEDGNIAYYVCNVEDCGQFFADEAGKTPISAESVVIAKGHVVGQLPGQKPVCTRCGETAGDEVMSIENWVFINLSTQGINAGTAEYVEIDGVTGTKFTLNAGTSAGSKWQIPMGDNHDGKQTVIPNLGTGASEGDVRNVILYYKNESAQEISITFQNDAGGGEGTAVIPANGVAICEFEITNYNGSNWFYVIINSDIVEQAAVTVYGYMYVNEGEVSDLSINTQASKLSFKEGETFSAAGLVLDTKILSNNSKPIIVRSGYVTDLDGYVFTAEDVEAGQKTVTVSFAGKTITYNVLVNAHDHQLVLVDRVEPVKCTTDGVEAYYKCTVDGCTAIFADEAGNVKIDAPVAISCHNGVALPGQKATCQDCANQFGEVLNPNGWVQFRPAAEYGNAPDSPAAEYADVDGVLGSKYTFAAGTEAGKYYQLKMWDDSDKQVPVINSGDIALYGNRKVIMYYHNYGAEAITLKFRNDTGNGENVVTVPAGSVVVSQFEVSAEGGSNWFELYTVNAVETEVTVGIYGYFYISEGEVESLTVKTPATKLTYKVGETFSAEGLVLNARIPSSNTKTAIVVGGYTVDLEGVTFTDAQVGTQTVTVTFAGATVTYEITVEAAQPSIEEGTFVSNGTYAENGAWENLA
ncbi:MAG: bacterial Ig-like domain-containing protein [Clostridia bacterium]|nr:bacterial Ig-like domain-containing protein [Clostridia bacterium]